MADNGDKDMTTRMMLEQIREDIKKLGEGVEDVKRRLSEEIKDIGRHWDTKWSPHDLTLRNHEKRIRGLEQRRRIR
jgi:predicted transposase YbfD/YdcC